MASPFRQLGFGGAGLTSLPTHVHAQRLLRTAFDAGITHFDTAPVYGQGYSEKLLGAFLRGRRDRVTLATKFGLAPGRAPTLPPWLVLPLNYTRRRLARPVPARAFSAHAPLLSPRPITRREISASFDASRRALGTEMIDLYLLHEALPPFLDADAVEFLLSLRRSGAIRQLGVAAGGRNYLSLPSDAFANWDVLQYECGPAWPAAHLALRTRFPAQRHIYHSCLSDLRNVARPDVDPADLPGVILRECAAANPDGRVLFFSGNPAHLRRNLRIFAGG